MPTIDYCHDGTEHAYEATTYTLMIYEQEFKGDLIKDVFGRVDLRKAAENIDDFGNPRYIDYTIDNWTAYPRAFWAMLKTSEAIARADGEKPERVPDFVEWMMLHTRGIDMTELSNTVVAECNRGLFHAGAADSD